jgi:hypothetical protein
MGIVRDPLRSLARVTCTKKGICNCVALAQIAVVRTSGSCVKVSRAGKSIDSERCESDETRLVGAKQYKEGNSQPPLHVDIMYAAIKHGSWPRVLKL